MPFRGIDLELSSCLMFLAENLSRSHLRSVEDQNHSDIENISVNEEPVLAIETLLTSLREMELLTIGDTAYLHSLN